MKCTLLASLALLSVALAAPTAIKRRDGGSDIECITDQLLFSDSIQAFEAARNTRQPSNLIWDSDNCSDSPDNPLGFNFVPSCQRHDFGYRNYKAQGRFTSANKAKIDSNFKTDLDNQCDTYSFVRKEPCLGLADVYYEAVKKFGHKLKRSARLEQVTEQTE